jgi:hypothetical protein
MGQPEGLTTEKQLILQPLGECGANLLRIRWEWTVQCLFSPAFHAVQEIKVVHRNKGSNRESPSCHHYGRGPERRAVDDLREAYAEAVCRDGSDGFGYHALDNAQNDKLIDRREYPGETFTNLTRRKVRECHTGG